MLSSLEIEAIVEQNDLSLRQRTELMHAASKHDDYEERYRKMVAQILWDLNQWHYHNFSDQAEFLIESPDSELKNESSTPDPAERKTLGRRMLAKMFSFPGKLSRYLGLSLPDPEFYPEVLGSNGYLRPFLIVTLQTRPEDLTRLMHLSRSKTLAITINSRDFLEHTNFVALPRKSTQESKDSKAV